MLDKTFKSRLSKLSSKKKDDAVVLEFVLTHISEEVLQVFLASVDEAYNLFLRHAFVSDRIDWKRIMYDIHLTNLKVTFDALKMVADLVGINVSRKRAKEADIFRYDLIFNKAHNPDIDSTFAITFLNRKEEDEDGKKTFVEYDTIITRE